MDFSLLLMLRGRDRMVESGGSASFDLGPTLLGSYESKPEPVAVFGPVDVSRIRQLPGAVGYSEHFGEHLQANVGLQKVRYEGSFRHLGTATRTTSSPWLYDGGAVLTPLPGVTVYTTYVRGLEENGAAPENAANRNEQLPPAQTTQIDGGVRLDHGHAHLIVSLFQIRKPYYSFDAGNVFTQVGDVRHRGAEASLSALMWGRMNLLVGAVAIDPMVIGEARRLGRVGKRPVGATSFLARIDADYRTPVRGLSLNGAVVYNARRIASARTYAELGGDQVAIDGFTTFDVGGRYRFKVGGTDLALRVLLLNVTNAKAWKVIAANSYQAADIRRLAVALAADF